MKNHQHFIGIDISKLSLDYCVVHQDGHIVSRGKLRNDLGGIEHFIDHLDKREESLFIFENTGFYGGCLHEVLSTQGLDYAEVPAIEIKRSLGIARGKSDRSDAVQIAKYGLRNRDKIQLSQNPGLCYQKLQLLYGEREKLVAAIKSFERTMECESYYRKEATKLLKKINSKTVKQLKLQLDQINQELSILLRSEEELRHQQELLKSIPGVGEMVSVYVLLVTRGFTRFKNWRKFACYSGVAPFEHRSGTSVRGKTRVSPMGNKKMKSLLHLSVLTALKYDTELKIYYDKKKAEGKHSLVVMNAVKCKLISRIFSVIERDTPYVKTMKYAS